MNRKKWITLIIVTAVLVGGFFGVRAMGTNAQAALTADLQTEKAQIGSLVATVGATGTVRANQTVNLSWQTSGTIAEVLVGLGDDVHAGEILANLEQTSLAQNVILAQADLVNSENALDDLLKSSDALAIALAEKEVADARDQVERAQDTYDSVTYTGEETDIDKAYRKLIQAEQELNDADAAYERLKSKPNTYKYFQALNRLNTARNDYRIALSNYNYLTGASIDSVDLAQAEANLAVAQQRLADAEEKLATLQAGPDPKDVSAAEARVAAAKAALKQARIEAPFQGTVTSVNVMPGDQISMGTPAFRVDDLSRLLVDVDISEVDINRVLVGQKAVLTFDAILATEYQGEVVEVAPVGTLVQGVVNFKVTIELTNPDQAVKPGMTAAVNIVVSELEDVLLVPNRAVRVVDGERVVYVLNNGQIESVGIILGASADLYSEVVGGDLKSGDLIILNPPANMMEMGGPPAFMRN